MPQTIGQRKEFRTYISGREEREIEGPTPGFIVFLFIVIAVTVIAFLWAYRV